MNAKGLLNISRIKNNTFLISITQLERKWKFSKSTSRFSTRSQPDVKFNNIEKT